MRKYEELRRKYESSPFLQFFNPFDSRLRLLPYLRPSSTISPRSSSALNAAIHICTDAFRISPALSLRDKAGYPL